MLLTILPDDLLIELLSMWLTCPSWILLDTACCNCAKREHFLENIFKNPNCILGANEEYHQDCIEWIVLRNIKLRRLCVGHCEMDDITSVCNDLIPSELTVICVPYDSEFCGADIKCLISLINRATKLTKLEVNFGDELLSEKVSNPKISSHILKNITQLDITCIEYNDHTFSSESAEYIADTCSNLTFLSIDLTCDNYCEEASLRNILQANPKLEILKLSGWYDNSLTLIPTVTELCPELKELKLDHSSNIDYKDILQLLHNCKHLKSIYISRTSARGTVEIYSFKQNEMVYIGDSKENDRLYLYEVLKFCRNLTSIKLNSCSGITSEMIRCLAENNATTCVEFKVLNCGDQYNFYSLEYVLTKCASQLQAFALRDATHITNENLINLFNIPNKIQKLVIANHATVTTDVIMEIVASNPEITLLGIYYCPLVLQAELTSILDSMGRINILKFNDVFSVV